MHSNRSLAPAALALALAAIPATASAQDTRADLYIDVATHTMPGMGGLGAIGRFAGAMSGGNARYGMARHPGMPGRYMDVALRSRIQPGAPATQAVPRSLRLGDRIDLLPPADTQSRNDGGNSTPSGAALADGGPYTVRYYWGCGDQAQPGQPATFTMSVRNGEPVHSGQAMSPRSVPRDGIDVGPNDALWPNPSTRKAVSTRSSLAGTHELTGDGVPAAMQFDLGAGHDFMPELALEREDTGPGTLLRWDGVDGARAYFIHATAMDGDSVVMWSSAADGYAGPELMDFLPGPLVDQWAREGTLLAADARSCRIPDGVFANGAPMVQMIAYGNVHTITDPSGSDWSVRVRTKSTAMLMPSGVAAPSAREAAQETGKSMLRGLFRR